MVCTYSQSGGGLSNEELFQKAFADRFASLDSLVSSSSSSDAGGCPPCAALLAEPSVSGGGSMAAQWIVFSLLLVGILLVLYYVFERMRGGDRHHHRPRSMGSQMAGHAGMPGVPGMPAMPAMSGDGKGLAQAVQDAVEVVKHHIEVKKTKGDRLAVVMLHAEWCGHCKSTMPEFKAVAEKYRDKCDFKVAENEVIKGTPLIEEIKLPGFPMTLFVRGGRVLESKVGGYKRGDLTAILDRLLSAQA